LKKKTVEKLLKGLRKKLSDKRWQFDEKRRTERENLEDLERLDKEIFHICREELRTSFLDSEEQDSVLYPSPTSNNPHLAPTIVLRLITEAGITGAAPVLNFDPALSLVTAGPEYYKTTLEYFQKRFVNLRNEHAEQLRNLVLRRSSVFGGCLPEDVLDKVDEFLMGKRPSSSDSGLRRHF